MRRADLAAVVAGAAGLAGAATGWIVDAQGFHGAWLPALVFVAGWPLGSMALLLTHALTGGRWGDVLGPALLTGVRALPMLALAAIPLAAGLPDTYAWARPHAHPANGFYLNVPFFAVRGAIYLIVWFALGAAILSGNARRLAGPGLFVLAVTASFAAIDTTMSLDANFTSSIYGMMTGAGMGLLALSAAVLLTAGAVAEDVRADLGRLLLALVILWIYLDFMQLLIVWQSDLASESPWYLARSRGLWGAVRVVVACGHFVLPIALLITPRWQRSRPVIIGVASLLIAMEALRAWWTVLPALHRFIGWIDVACMAGLGGATLSFALWTSRRPVLAGNRRHV